MGDLARAVRESESEKVGLEHWEAVAILFQLVVGGIETTVGLIGAAIKHAAQMQDGWSRHGAPPGYLT
jgi:cytochrome P450